MSHLTFILALFLSIFSKVIVFLPIIGPSTICISICYSLFYSNVIISLHILFLNDIVVSLSMVLPSFLILLIDLIPCQYWKSLSTSEIIAHTLSRGKLIILFANIIAIILISI